ncbi:hyaluronan mediated motility receptor [Gadus macrocephalus]|uniref:hyaluronan mediated motility receptor n=1 Tax=Gadus macrocephalus TaxID=80720 RepID=UPI0028CB30F4|nr:hyaluronan mediated motility receptor [Gadus macrocephalus]
MSFSRAPLKRFNENIGCAPAPGTYNPKDEGHKGPASFQKSQRFTTVKPVWTSPIPPPCPDVPMTPVRRTMSVDGLVGSSVKKEKPGISLELKRHKLLEKEIRSLVTQRGEQDKRLLALEEELKRLEAKLLSAVRERTGLTASGTTLERQLAELKKANEFLKNKVSADTTKKRINSLTMELIDARNNLDLKTKEISMLQVNTASQVKILETDLQAAKATVKTLRERNQDLEDLQQETKAQNEELSSETEKLHAVIQELKEEIKVLQTYLDTANDQVQDLRLKIREKTALENTASESQRNSAGQLEQDLKISQEALRQREEESKNYQEELLASLQSLQDAEQRLESRGAELSASRAELRDIERQLERANEEAEACRGLVCQQGAELARLREVLRSTEKELDERMVHLAGRCLSYEEERGKMQEEGMRKVEQLKAELSTLQEVRREEEGKGMALKQAHTALSEELEKEKSLVDSLSLLLEHEREEAEVQRAQMKEEMEVVLGELALIEEQESRMQEEMDQRLQQENHHLVQQLSQASASLDRKSTEAALLEESHLTAMARLREEQTDYLSNLGGIATELESTKQALSGVEDRVRQLEAEEGRVAQHLKEELKRVIQQKEEEMETVMRTVEEQRERLLAAQQAEGTAREERVQMLCEVKTQLAQKDEKMKEMEGSHVLLLAQLQEEVSVQKREKEQALLQLGEQEGLKSSQLQREKEKAHALQAKTWQERDEAVEELQRTREANAAMQMALRELQELTEAEKSKGLQSRSEQLGLHIRLEKLEEERSRLLSRVEDLARDGSALREKLTSAGQDGEQLQARLESCRRESVSLQRAVESGEEEKAALRRELEVEQRDGRALQEQVELLAQEKVTLQWETAERNQELQRQLAEAREKSSLSSEAERWKKQYEDLYSNVKPFREQLNSFAAQRDLLLNENGANQDELNRLADAYAQLLGHQNQKQKIKHVIKLKEENITLKQEASKLRSMVSRQKSDLDHLRSKQPGAKQRRFDPSKAFQHDGSKENLQPDAPALGLREGNFHL